MNHYNYLYRKKHVAERLVNFAQDELQDATQRNGESRTDLGAAAAAAYDAHDLLGETGLLRLLPPRLLDVRALYWRGAVGRQVRLAVLELGLG